jgi:hypothetical protein
VKEFFTTARCEAAAKGDIALVIDDLETVAVHFDFFGADANDRLGVCWDGQRWVAIAKTCPE